MIGMRILDFWELTPYEFSLSVIAYGKKMKQKQEDQLVLTYLGAYWQRVDPKHFPKLKDILGDLKEPTPEEMLEEFKRMNDAMGGTTS